MKRSQWKRLMCLLLVMTMLAAVSVTAFAGESGAEPSYPLSGIQSSIDDILQHVISHENVILKALVRIPLRAAAAAGAVLGLTTAATMLNHSLQDAPEDLVYTSDSEYAQQIANSDEFKALAGSFGSSGGITFAKDPDLYLAFHGMSYAVDGNTVTFADTYDFADTMEPGETFSVQTIIAVANKLAVFAQAIGAIVPYDISVAVNMPVSE